MEFSVLKFKLNRFQFQIYVRFQIGDRGYNSESGWVKFD